MSPIIKEQEVPTATPETTAAPPAPRPVTAPEAAPKAQPVALEISVTVNGARTIEGTDKREPFSESTKTVLVLGNGAVIRLGSSVAPGQLLFLTNEKTKKEVVCQVVKSKNFRNVSGYVELEFTEPAVGFWGMRFPTDRIGSQPSANSPSAIGTPLVAVAPSPLPAPKQADKSPTSPVSVAPPQVAKPVDSKIPAPVVAAQPAVPVSPLRASGNESAPPVSPINSSYNSVSSSSPNASVLSLPRALELNPAAIAPKPNAPLATALPTVEASVNPMRRATDQKKPAPPAGEAKLAETNAGSAANSSKPEADRLQQQLSSLFAADASVGKTAETNPASAHPEISSVAASDSRPKAFEFTKPEAHSTFAKSSANSTVSFAATPSLDLQAEETKIPAWLEPLARNAAAPTSTHEWIEREKARHAAAAAEGLQPASVSEPVVEEIAQTHVEVPALTFGGAYVTEDKIISEGVSPSGSKKGMFIGILAATVAIAAGGWWYVQQGPHGSPAEPAVTTLPATANTAVSTPVQNATVPNSALSTNPSGAGQPGGLTTALTSKPNSPAAAPPAPQQNVPVGINASEKNARAAQTSVPQPKRPSLGDVRLATPNRNSAGAHTLSAEAAPSFTNDDVAADSLGAGVGLAESNHKQPAAPAPVLPVGGDVKPAKLLASVSPVYPALAKNQHISGDVKVDALVDAAGRVTTMKIVSGPTLLQQAAMDAIRGWKYQAATLDGKPVPMHLTVTLQFRLQQ